MSSLKTMESLEFVNSAVRSLPLDSVPDNYVRSVAGACFSKTSPTPLQNPALVVHSQEAMALLDLPASLAQSSDLVGYLSGNRLIPGSEPAAHCYCGHQFGNFAGQLGDGCAILLGEVRNSEGERWELQLKGSGKTPYSRSADGRKVLRSSIREFLCSEAMFHLGIPTTRAATCITSDDTVVRDILYNGNPIQERATVISRIAPTFLRFGSFEICKNRDPLTGRMGPSVGRADVLQSLIDYTISNFFPEVQSAFPDVRSRRVAGFFEEVCRRTARLVALWQCVGFCHGVLNTDNMSIVGVTIDYGPFGFLDRYDPDHICNGSDDGGRYRYSRQPAICRWNLGKLSEALAQYLSQDDVSRGLEVYDEVFESTYTSKMRLKLGLFKKDPGDREMISALLDSMHKTGADFSGTFLELSKFSASNNEQQNKVAVDALLSHCMTPEEMGRSTRPSMHARQLQMFQAMLQNSPDILTALGVSPESIAMELEKQQTMETLKGMSIEEKRMKDKDTWSLWIKSYQTRLMLEVEGLLPDQQVEVNKKRVDVMAQNNPRFVLRNHIAQRAIDMAENGDFSEVHNVLDVLRKPYSQGDPAVGRESCSQALSDNYLGRPSLSSLGTVVT